MMGKSGSKKAKEELPVEESSTDFEEENGNNFHIPNENVQAVRQEGQTGTDEKWWDQPVERGKKRSRKVRRNKRSRTRKALSRSQSSSSNEEGKRNNIWDTEEVIDVEEDEGLVTGIREKQRWAWAENGQGRREDNEEGEQQDIETSFNQNDETSLNQNDETRLNQNDETRLNQNDETSLKKNNETTAKDDNVSDEPINDKTFTKEQFKGQIVAHLSSKDIEQDSPNVQYNQKDLKNRSSKTNAHDQADIYNWPLPDGIQSSPKQSNAATKETSVGAKKISREEGYLERNEVLEAAKKQQCETDRQDRRERRKSYMRRIKFWTEENLLRSTDYSEFNVTRESPKYQSARKNMLKVLPNIQVNISVCRKDLRFSLIH